MIQIFANGLFQGECAAMAPAFDCGCVSSADQRSTWLSQEAEVGVKCG